MGNILSTTYIGICGHVGVKSRFSLKGINSSICDDCQRYELEQEARQIVDQLIQDPLFIQHVPAGDEVNVCIKHAHHNSMEMHVVYVPGGFRTRVVLMVKDRVTVPTRDGNVTTHTSSLSSHELQLMLQRVFREKGFTTHWIDTVTFTMQRII